VDRLVTTTEAPQHQAVLRGVVTGKETIWEPLRVLVEQRETLIGIGERLRSHAFFSVSVLIRASSGRAHGVSSSVPPHAYALCGGGSQPCSC
jgi:hypothetical protein